jgi:hypothetical protein
MSGWVSQVMKFSGPVALPNRLTSAVYRHEWFTSILGTCASSSKHRMWFKHDGEPTHFLRIMRQHLNQTFGEQWLGCGGPVNWPAWSPDLNTLDFWLLEHVNILVYSASISDLQVLQQRVEIRVKSGISDRVRTSCSEEIKLVLKWMGTTQSICCRDHTNTDHVSAGNGSSTYTFTETFSSFK